LHDVRPGEPKIDLPCNICLGTADSIFGMLTDGRPLQDIIDTIVPICSLFVWDEEVCRGLMEINTVSIIYV
jgi:hypothetical protein